MKIITVTEMKYLESACSGIDLMLNAGTNAAHEIIRFTEDRLLPRHRRRFTILAGKGNNGGDAFVVAQCLAEAGLTVNVLSLSPRDALKGDAARHAARLKLPITVLDGQLPDYALTPGTVIVDGLLGTGCHGSVRDPVAVLIRQINGSGLPVISLDVPSGLDADSGTGAPVVTADLTVTMAFCKPGMFKASGPEACGLLRVASIGLPMILTESARGTGIDAFTETDAAALLPRRPRAAHKNTFGHLLCLAGAATYPGAPFLAAEAALLSGAGLVTLATPAASLCRQGSAALLVAPLGPPDAASFNDSMLKQAAPLFQRATALLYGPGTGPGVPPAFLQALLETGLPIVIDADGLRLLAANPALLPALSANGAAVLTPHPGEMHALLDGFGLPQFASATRTEQADELANRCHATVILKGLQSVVAAPGRPPSINLTGGPALATAGTGDVLAGITAAFLAQHLTPFDAARLAAFLHGHAADIHPGAVRSLTADSLLTQIPIALADISPTA